jgi:hypothetical protein
MRKLLLLLLTFVLVGCVSVNVTPGNESDEPGDVEEETTDEVVVDESEEEEEVEEAVEEEEEVVDDEENIGCGGPDCDNEMLVESYYNLLAEGDLETAYSMKHEPSVSFNTFVSWYKNVLSAEVRNYEDIGDGKYQFTVDLSETGGVENSFFVVMKVRDGLLDTVSSDNLTVMEGTEVYVTVHTNGEDLHVVKDGEEVLVEEFRLDYDDPVRMNDLIDYVLTNDGRFLAYKIGLWEAVAAKVYDIENEEYVLDEFGAANYGFTDDEKYFYECTETGMIGPMMKIYSVPSFTLSRDLTPTESGMMLMECYGYNSYDNSYAYALTPDWNEIHQQRYYFDTNTVE